MAKGHNKRERTLLKDISDKNRLVNRISKLSRLIKRWKKRTNKNCGKRVKARHLDSMNRYSQELGTLEQQVLNQAQDIKTRIEGELKISDTETIEFQKQYKKEIDELMQARAKIKESRKALEQAKTAVEEGKAPEDPKVTAEVLTHLEANYGKSLAKEKKEARDVKAVVTELSSEEKDRKLLERELKKTIAELTALSKS